jgi:hypothetical protein
MHGKLLNSAMYELSFCSNVENSPFGDIISTYLILRSPDGTEIVVVPAVVTADAYNLKASIFNSL